LSPINNLHLSYVVRCVIYPSTLGSPLKSLILFGQSTE
jgi:hypothetical protein